jgi:hypothetical protein
LLCFHQRTRKSGDIFDIALDEMQGKSLRTAWPDARETAELVDE